MRVSGLMDHAEGHRRAGEGMALAAGADERVDRGVRGFARFRGAGGRRHRARRREEERGQRERGGGTGGVSMH